MPVYNYTGTWRREPQSGSPHSGNPQSGDRDSPSDAFGRTPGPFESTVFPQGIPMGQDRRIRPLCHHCDTKPIL